MVDQILTAPAFNVPVNARELKWMAAAQFA